MKVEPIYKKHLIKQLCMRLKKRNIHNASFLLVSIFLFFILFIFALYLIFPPYRTALRESRASSIHTGIHFLLYIGFRPLPTSLLVGGLTSLARRRLCLGGHKSCRQQRPHCHHGSCSSGHDGVPSSALPLRPHSSLVVSFW